MGSNIVVVVMATLLTVASSVHVLEYQCQEQGIMITLKTETGVEVAALFSGATDCEYAVDESPTTVTILDGAGVPLAALPCGVTQDNTVPTNTKVFDLTLKTSSCTGTYCLKEDDADFPPVKCNFDLPPSQIISVVGVQVTGQPKIGDVTVGTEAIVMSIHTVDGSGVATPVNPAVPVTLDKQLMLRAVLTKSAYAKGIRLTLCKATDAGPATDTIDMYDVNGCSGTGSIPAFITGSFTKQSDDATTFTSECPEFPVFLFHAGAGTITFICTATYCGTLTDPECVNSCVDPAGRKRRQAPPERTVKVTVRVTTDNTTSAAQRTAPDQKVQCENRSYVIGLVILGCVLTLTFIVTIGMFVVLRRGRRDNAGDKIGYDNKSMS